MIVVSAPRLAIVALAFALGSWIGCSGEGRPICRCASDCSEGQFCLDAAGRSVTTCLDPSAAAGSCVPAGTSNNDAGVEPPDIEPELYDLLWSKRDLAEIEPDTDTSAIDSDSSSASDSVSATTSDSTSDSLTSSGLPSESGSTSDTSASSDSTASTLSSGSSGSSG